MSPEDYSVLRQRYAVLLTDLGAPDFASARRKIRALRETQGHRLDRLVALAQKSANLGAELESYNGNDIDIIMSLHTQKRATDAQLAELREELRG